MDSTCAQKGSYDSVVYCTECNTELSRNTNTIEKKPHIEGEAVEENKVDSTCAQKGSYDSVVYCTECNTELSRITETIEKKEHTSGEAVEENKVDSTCTQEGTFDSVVYCTECNTELSRITETIEKKEHTSGEIVIENIVEATCTTEGSYDKVVYCTKCNVEVSRETIIIPASHNYGEWEVNSPVTCTQNGEEFRVCNRCEEEERREVEALGHSLSDWIIIREKTCTEDGERERICTRENCDYVEREIMRATGHRIVTIPAVEPTCTRPGLTEGKKCSVCGLILEAQIEIEAKIHDFSRWIVIEDATCENDGKIQRTCRKCHEKEIKIAEGYGHEYEHKITNPTCTQDGYTTHTCIKCDKTYTNNIVKAKGHTEETINGKEATCTQSGLTEGKKCSECGEITVEQREISPLRHEYGEWIIIKEATCEEDGQMKKQCIRENCKDEQTQIINALGHEETVISAVEATCTQTGLTEGKKCVECDKILVAQKEIPVSDHEYGSWIIDKEATYEEEGHKHRVCIKCNINEQEEVISKLTKEELEVETEYAVKEENNLKYLMIASKNTQEEILKNIRANKDLKIVDKNGKEIQEASLIGTGAKVITEQNEEVYVIVVKGDINGDGKIDFINDIVALNISSQLTFCT